MNKRGLFYVFLLPILLLGVLWGVPKLLTQLIDEQSLVMQIEQSVADNTPLALTIKGSVSVKSGLSPTLELQSLEIRDAVSGAPIATVKQVTAKVSWLSILSKKHHVSDLAIDGVYMLPTHDLSQRLKSLMDQQSTWGEKLANVPMPDIALQDVLIDLSHITVLDDWFQKDLLALKSITIKSLDMATLSGNMALKGMLAGEKNIEYYDLDFSAYVAYDKLAKRLVFTDVSGHSALEDGHHDHSHDEMHIIADRMHWQHEKQKMQAQNLRFSVNELSGIADIQAQLGERYRWQAALHIEAFNADALNAILINIPFIESYWPIPKVYLGKTDVTVIGDPQQIDIKNLHTSLAGNALTGNITHRLQAPLMSTFDLSSPQLSVENLITLGNKTTQSVYEETFLPSWLWKLPIRGQWKIGRLVANVHEFGDMTCAFDTLDRSYLSEINCHWSHPTFTLSGDARLSKGDDTSQMATTITIQRLPIREWLQKQGSELADTFSGSIAGTIDLKATGERPIDWLKTLSGKARLDLDQASVQALNLNNLIAQAIAQSTIQDLSVVLGAEGRLPLSNRSTVKVADAKLDVTFANGKAMLKDFFFTSDHGDQVVANARIDLATMGVDIESAVILGRLRANGYLSDFPWPFRCQGSLKDQTFDDICQASTGHLEQLVSQVVAQQNRERVEAETKQAIDDLSATNVDPAAEEKLKAELQQSLLDSIFGQ